jgi:FixJ family two-component response regulator
MISIVDNDVCAREATERVIQSLGYAVATYASAEELLDSDQINDTSCLITDVHMPGLTGVELYRRLRANGFTAPTIVVTGQPDESMRTQVLDAGAIAFLSKPFAKKVLLGYLKAALVSHKADDLASIVETHPGSHNWCKQSFWGE